MKIYRENKVHRNIRINKMHQQKVNQISFDLEKIQKFRKNKNLICQKERKQNKKSIL